MSGEDATVLTGRLSGVRALTFDLMGTCADWHSSLLRIMATLPPIGVEHSLLATRWRAGFFASIFESFARGEQSPDIDIVHREVLDSLLLEMGRGDVTWSEQERAKLVQGWHRQLAWPDAVEGIERLKRSYDVVVPVKPVWPAVSSDLIGPDQDWRSAVDHLTRPTSCIVVVEDQVDSPRLKDFGPVVSPIVENHLTKDGEIIRGRKYSSMARDTIESPGVLIVHCSSHRLRPGRFEDRAKHLDLELGGSDPMIANIVKCVHHTQRHGEVLVDELVQSLAAKHLEDEPDIHKIEIRIQAPPRDISPVQLQLFPMSIRKNVETTVYTVDEDMAGRLEADRLEFQSRSWLYRFGVNSWTQIVIVGANASVALLSVGAGTVIFVAQPIFDIVGVRAILIGGWTYALYTGSLLNYNRTHNGAFVIASGAILGLGAALIWITQGAIMLSYPLPHQKGRSIALFWVIFNLGGAIGSFIAFGLNGTVSDATYIAYIVIMLIGWVSCIALVPSHLVRRTDGSRAAPLPSQIVDKVPWWQNFSRVARREVKHIIELKDEWRIWFLIPMCFAANWFYSYQQNEVNGLAFTLRSRSLNSALYWAAQMFGGVIIGFLLDMPYLNRPRRALVGWIFVFVTGNAIMGGGLAFQNWFISNWCVIAICLVVALPAILKITEPTEQEARGDYLVEEEDHPGAVYKQEAAARHGQLVHEKVATEVKV
ncbi:hypothetical protein P7C73_g2694, partial [Tremellales sp. Uapishka_1]